MHNAMVKSKGARCRFRIRLISVVTDDTKIKSIETNQQHRCKNGKKSSASVQKYSETMDKNSNDMMIFIYISCKRLELLC